MRPMEKLVLMAIEYLADENETYYGGTDNLSDMTGLHPNTVRAHLVTLCRDGYLSSHPMTNELTEKAGVSMRSHNRKIYRLTTKYPCGIESNMRKHRRQHGKDTQHSPVTMD